MISLQTTPSLLFLLLKQGQSEVVLYFLALKKPSVKELNNAMRMDNEQVPLPAQKGEKYRKLSFQTRTNLQSMVTLTSVFSTVHMQMRQFKISFITARVCTHERPFFICFTCRSNNCRSYSWHSPHILNGIKNMFLYAIWYQQSKTWKKSS